MTLTPRTARGAATRARLLTAAEAVFGDLGYHEASIARITETAGVGQGTYYLYFSNHPSLYRIFREAELVTPRVVRAQYARIADGYIRGIRAAATSEEISDVDPTVAVWALMGVGEMIGKRWVLWESDPPIHDPGGQAGISGGLVQEHVFDEMMRFVAGALGISSSPRVHMQSARSAPAS